MVFVGESVTVTGKVICTQGEDEITPQEGWDVYVRGQAPSEYDVMAPLVQTDGDGNFTAYLPVDILYIQEILIIACYTESDSQIVRLTLAGGLKAGRVGLAL